MYLSQDVVRPYIASGLISEQKHPLCADVRIYNYTQACQYARAWDAVTLRCRGLILDIERERILANPFEKFFNYTEMPITIPDETPVITEKLDGSLGVLYWLNDEPWIATRGSFTSEQAQWGTRWFRERVDWRHLDRDTTYLFEIIYRENRIVVQYDYEALVLLAARETATGVDLHLTGYKDIFPYVVTHVPPCDVDTLAQMDAADGEGFVVHYPGAGLRVKIKFPTYVRLHRIVTGLSVKGIWEHLSTGNTLADLVQNVPDEFYIWVDTIAARLTRQYTAIEASSRAMVEMVRTLPTRKAQAEQITQHRYPGVCFAMLDGKRYEQVIWKLLQPSGAQTFRVDPEEA